MKGFRSDVEHILWAERLSLSLMVRVSIKKFFCNVTVYYEEHNISATAGYVLNKLKRFHLEKIFSKAEFSLGKRTSDSGTLFYEVLKSLNVYSQAFLSKHAAYESDRHKKMMSCYMSSGELLERVSFATVAESESIRLNKERNSTKKMHQLWLKRHPLNNPIISFYSGKGFEVKQTGSIVEYIKFFLRPFYYLIAVLCGRVQNKQTRSNISVIRPAVWMEYSHKDVVDLNFWCKAAASDNFDVVYYLDRAETPPSKEITSSIEKIGLKWIDAHFIPMVSAVSIDLASVWPKIKALFSFSSAPIWYRIIMLEYSLWYAYYRAVFERFKVKVLIQIQDTSWRMEAQARAMEDAGGIMIGVHWSSYHCVLSPTHLFPFHVYFVWGGLMRNFLESGGHSCGSVLPSGCWVKTETPKPEVQPLLSQNLSFVITVFDSSTGYIAHQTPNTMLQFYKMILTLLEKKQNWGVIIKSKNFEVNMPHDREEIVGRLENLTKEGRAIVLDRLVSPYAAAAKADLSVCYGLNSAGIIAAMRGCKAIHWDCSGWTKHPFYTDPEQRFIFRTLDELEQAIIQAADGDRGIGDFSKWRQAVNYFDDLRAPERIGKFIRNFMDEVVRTGNTKRSLEQSVSNYIRLNNISDFYKTGEPISEKQESMCSEVIKEV